MKEETRPGAAEVWRGGVSAWECDEMGHMNTRFYMSRGLEGLSALLARAGMPGQFARATATAIDVAEAHIRFHREARAPTPLHMNAGFSRVGADDAEVVLVLRHSVDDVLAATFRLALRHVTPQGAPTPWPDGFRDRAAAFGTVVPREAQPRSVGSGPVRADVGALPGYTCIAMGCLGAADCDPLGRMLPQKFGGVVSDGIRRLTAPLRTVVIRHAETPPARFGGAVLEFRVVQLGSPMAGDCFEVRSTFRRADGHTLVLEHWMTDPLSGRVWGYMESIAVVLDLERRRIVGISEPAHAELAALAKA